MYSIHNTYDSEAALMRVVLSIGPILASMFVLFVVIYVWGFPHSRHKSINWILGPVLLALALVAFVYGFTNLLTDGLT